MKISTKGRYALRMMVDLGMYDTGGYTSLRDISRRQEISVKYMEQIVSQLTKAGFLYSVRGPQGGYRLARDPHQYTIGEILRVTEGSLAPVACLERVPNPCERTHICPTLQFWEDLYALLSEFVDSVTLHDLLVREMQRVEDGRTAEVMSIG